MIITRTPLRIPLGGGGTDLPEFYRKHGSFFMSAAIDYYIYIAVKRRPIKSIRLAYSQIEEVEKISQIKHQLIKACLEYMKPDEDRGLEIVSIGDLPAGTGMGSSGSFAVGVLNALRHMNNIPVTQQILAKEACYVNMDVLKGPSGKQDEYIAACGGIKCFEINKEGKVKIFPLQISSRTIAELQQNMLMFYTGITRNANKVLMQQKSDKKTTDNLKKIQEIAYEIKEALEDGKTTTFGRLLDKHWAVKRRRQGVTKSKIDKWYEIAIENGAVGGKLMGAGGGGFFLFYAEDKKEKLRKTLAREGLEEVKFHFDFEGTKLLMNV